MMNKDKVRISLAKEYLSRMDKIVTVSEEIVTVIADGAFNVKLSLSILRGGIKDFQNGKVGSDIYEELTGIRKNLASCLSLKRKVESRIEKLTDIEANSLLRAEISGNHIRKIMSFRREIEEFLIKSKISIDKMYDLLNIILHEEDIKRITDQNIEKWFLACRNLLDKLLQGVKVFKQASKKVKNENDEYRKIIPEEQETKTEDNLEENNVKKTTRKKSEWKSQGDGKTHVFVRKEEN